MHFILKSFYPLQPLLKIYDGKIKYTTKYLQSKDYHKVTDTWQNEYYNGLLIHFTSFQNGAVSDIFSHTQTQNEKGMNWGQRQSFDSVLWLLSTSLHKQPLSATTKKKCGPFKSRGKLLNYRKKTLVSSKDRQGARWFERDKWRQDPVCMCVLETIVRGNLNCKKIIHEVLPFVLNFSSYWEECNTQM